MSALRRVAIVVLLVVLLPLLVTIAIAWSNDSPGTLPGLVRSVCYWQAFFWAGSLLMAYVVTLASFVATGRIGVVAGDCDEMPGAMESSWSEIGTHPMTGNMTMGGIDVMTGYCTADYPSHTPD